MQTPDALARHVNRVWMVVLNIHLRRALTAADDRPRLNFWRLIYGDLLDMAVLEWCKIFGTDNEPTHWKTIVADHDEFRTTLLVALGIDHSGWTAYWEQMKGYRDTAVAHHIEPFAVTHYPSLDLALESCYFYYDYLIQRLREQGDRRFPNDLREYCARFAVQAKDIAQRALASTAELEERVF